MPPLKNQQHELFCLALLSGMNQQDAAIKAGYNPNWARSHASHLATKNNIIKRRLELSALTESDTTMPVKERKERLSEIARGRITDYQTSEGIHIDQYSPNTGAIEGLEIRQRTSRDSQAGTITIKRPTIPEAMRNSIFERDGNKCVKCSSTTNLQIDHIISLSKGGHTIEGNLQTLCEECNKVKGAGKKSQVYITTKLKLHNPIVAIAELNKMDHIYTEPPAAGDIVQNFVFILPDGTRVLPAELGKQKELGSGEGEVPKAV